MAVKLGHGSLKLLLVRHAQSVRDETIPDNYWPLSEAGEQQAATLTNTMTVHDIHTIYSSPFERAKATVGPLAKALGTEINIQPDLRERKLSDGLIDNWKTVIEQSWIDRSFKLQGCESASECQERVYECIEKIATAHSSGTVVACSHGNAIALFLNRVEPSFGFEDWLAMRNPHVFELAREDGAWRLA